MVIVLAEGAGQELMAESMRSTEMQDPSGNKLLLDVGMWLSQKIKVDVSSFFTPSLRFLSSVFNQSFPYQYINAGSFH